MTTTSSRWDSRAWFILQVLAFLALFNLTALFFFANPSAFVAFRYMGY